MAVIIAEIVDCRPARRRAGFDVMIAEPSTGEGLGTVFMAHPLPPGSELVRVGAVVALDLKGWDVVGVELVDFRPDGVVVDLHRYPPVRAA